MSHLRSFTDGESDGRQEYSSVLSQPSTRNNSDGPRSCYDDEEERSELCFESQNMLNTRHHDEGLDLQRMSVQHEEASYTSIDPEIGLPFHKKRKGKLIITIVSIVIFVLIALVLIVTKTNNTGNDKKPLQSGGNGVMVATPTISPTTSVRTRSPIEQMPDSPTIETTLAPLSPAISVPSAPASPVIRAPISSNSPVPTIVASMIPSALPVEPTDAPTYTPLVASRKEKFGMLVKALAYEGITNADELLTVGGRKTPQIRAIDWMLDDDPQDLLGATASTMSTRVFQRYILASIFYSVDGGQWKASEEWLNSAHECEWYGVSCEERDVTSTPLLRGNLESKSDQAVIKEQIVVSLALEESNMVGTLPIEIGYLTDCSVLSLYGNALDGTLPTTIGLMEKLEKFWIDENEFTGVIPSEIGLLQNIIDISIYENQLIGSLPSEISLLSRLERFWANDMQISGNIPTEFGKLTNLVNLYLDGNSITGEIPSEIGRMTNLRDFRLFRNRMGGTLPTELFALSKLEIAYLDTNRFRGIIPREISGLSSIKDFQLFSNRLSGTIPLGIGDLDNLQILRLNGNDFTGTIPAKLGSNEKLLRITLSSNRLVGTIPTSLQQASLLKRIELDRNNLDGTLPEWIGSSLNEILTLSLASNRIEGNIPASFGNLKKLEEVRLEDNDITGKIPKEWCNLETLREGILISDCEGAFPQVECSCCTSCSGVTALIARTNGVHR